MGRVSEKRMVLVRKTSLNQLPVIAVVVLGVFCAAALFPQFFASEGPFAEDVTRRLQPPSWEHPFGTDELGRDLLSRVVHGTRTTLGTSLLALAIASAIAVSVGIVAGYLRSVTDRVLMLFIDVLLALPTLLVSLLIIFALGAGTVNLALAVGLASVPPFARVTRAEVLRVSAEPFVEAARANGVNPIRILVRHVLPHATRPVIALATLELASIVLAVSVLSFLGYGTTPPNPEWGNLISEGRGYFSTAWWLTGLPGAVLVAFVLALHRLGRSLTDKQEVWSA